MNLFRQIVCVRSRFSHRSSARCGFTRSGRGPLGPSLARVANLSGLFYCPDCSLKARSGRSNYPSGLQLPTEAQALSGVRINFCRAFRELRSNRAVPAGNAPASRRRVIRTDNHGPVGSNRAGRLRVGAMTGRSFCVTTPSAVCHARVRARGLWLVASEPRDTSKAPNLVLKEQAFQAAADPPGFAVCNRPEPKEQSVQSAPVQYSHLQYQSVQYSTST